jgi:hypothetical protein
MATYTSPKRGKSVLSLSFEGGKGGAFFCFFSVEKVHAKYQL